MIDWKSFYANGGYYGLNDPDFYDDGHPDTDYDNDELFNEKENHYDKDNIQDDPLP